MGQGSFDSLQGVLPLVLALCTALATALLLRLSACLPHFARRPAVRSPPSLLVVLGSGGHTAEMIRLLRNVDPLSFSSVHFVIAKVSEVNPSQRIPLSPGRPTSPASGECGRRL